MELDLSVLSIFFWEWGEFALRWLHVITAIAWIGSSFYFIALDLGLRRKGLATKGVHGEEWQVHGGGFYHIQKYLLAPEAMPEHLTWFKWESYMTWISGFCLMAVIYYLGADLYLIDPAKIAFEPWQAILVSVLSLVILWLVYDVLCKSKFGENNTYLMIGLFAALVLLSWGYDQIFTDRAAFLHLGAITATVMSGNVAMVIIPNQKIVVADLKAGRRPDPKYGKIAKQRSTHNNYLTLPVLFLMLSNHYPLAFATDYGWIIAALVFLMGVTIRHYFNTTHARAGNPRWTWAATTGLFLVIMTLSLAPLLQNNDLDEDVSEGRAPTEVELALMNSHGFEEVYDITQTHCVMCHASEVYYDGLITAPKGVILEHPYQVAAYAESIFKQSGISHAMPPPSANYMESNERRAIVEWYLNVRKING